MARVAPEKMGSRPILPLSFLFSGTAGVCMPNRILREGILTSERIDLLNFEEELFYRRLMSVVDDFGRFEAIPKLLRSKCYPLKIDDVKNEDIEKWLFACVKAGLITVYSVSGKKFLEMIDFRQQKRAKESKYPSSDNECSADDIGCVADDAHMKSNAHLGEGVCEDVCDSNGENSTPSQESKTADTCPHQQIIDLYHEILPSARRIRDWTPSRAKVLRTRWREDKKRQNLEWWETLFKYIAGCDFLMGRISTPGRAPFEIALDWILKPENLIKIREGAYENRGTVA